MPLNPVYLLIHSRSATETPKPYFRIAAIELPDLSSDFLSHDHANYNYTNIRVTTSGTSFAEEWSVVLETTNNPNQDIAILDHFDTLERARAGIDYSSAVLPRVSRE
jgi:hypothetical protein